MPSAVLKSEASEIHRDVRHKFQHDDRTVECQWLGPSLTAQLRRPLTSFLTTDLKTTVAVCRLLPLDMPFKLTNLRASILQVAAV